VALLTHRDFVARISARSVVFLGGLGGLGGLGVLCERSFSAVVQAGAGAPSSFSPRRRKGTSVRSQVAERQSHSKGP
jgi:hypothetical protein